MDERPSRSATAAEREPQPTGAASAAAAPSSARAHDSQQASGSQHAPARQPSLPPKAASKSTPRVSRVTAAAAIAGQAPLPPSPLSSASTTSGRKRESSVSSSMSSTTEPTSAGEDTDVTPVAARRNEGGSKDSPDSARPLRTSLFQQRVPYSMLSMNDIATSTPSSSSSSNAINIPTSTPFSSGLVTSPSSSARLSTTPLFPSPLAQASRPDEDNEAADGDDEDADSDKDEDWQGRQSRKNSDQDRVANPAFADFDIQPSDDLDTSNALGLAAQSSQESFSLSGRPTASSSRFRSPGRPSNASLSLSTGHTRRRSKSGESDSMQSLRSASSLSPPSVTSGPSSPVHQRRQSTPYSSPSKAWPSPTASSASRGHRLSISSMPPASMPTPIPMAPPPSESIRLQKVPDSVRSAVEFRSVNVSSAPSLSSSIASPSKSPIAFNKLDVAAPRTPVATRVPTPRTGSPASGSGTPPSGAASRPASPVASAPISRRTSVDTNAVGNAGSSAVGSSSAFGPLFSLPASPSASSPGGHFRERSFSNFWSATTPGVEGQQALDRISELGISPRSSAMFVPTSQQPWSGDLMTGSLRASSSMRAPEGRGRKTSIVPSMSTSPVENTDQYAQILRDSRIAKIKQWMPGSSNAGDAAFGRASGLPTTPTFEGGPVPSDAEMNAAENEVEWVDWLEEYERMKQAKLNLESNPHNAQGDIPASLMRRSSSNQSDPLASAPWARAEPMTTAEGSNDSSAAFTAPASRTYFPLVQSKPTANAPVTTAAPFQAASPPDKSASAFASSSTANDINKAHRHGLTRHQSDFARPGYTKRHRKTGSKLGLKIDTWWNAVRSSFASTPSEEKPQSRFLVPPSNPNAPAAPRTSSQFTRPEPVRQKERSLRPVASAHDLQSPTSPTSSTVPTGALAPAARSMTPFGMSSSPPQRDESPARWRNPNLSLDLNLGPPFVGGSPSGFRPRNDLLNAKHQSDSAVLRATAAAPTPSPLPTASSVSQAASPSYFRSALPSAADSSATPASAIWDRTPGLVPVSTAGGHRPTLEAVQNQEDLATLPQTAFSMHTVRMHIKRRLGLAKENCDKELRKIIAGITEYVESELQTSTTSPPLQAGSGSLFGETFEDSDGVRSPGDLTEAETDSMPATSPHPSGTPQISRPSSRGGPIEGSSSLPHETLLTKPVFARRVSDQARVRSASSQSRSADGRRSVSGRRSALERKSGSLGPRSRSSSQSRSRPGSPFISDTSTSRAEGRLASPDDGAAASQASLIALLQDLIGIATEILDTPISKLTSKAGLCADYVHRVQEIGSAWDDAADLPCRGYYVQLLLAVAGLTRVVEWWEAEEGFWAFDEPGDDDDEPILFVAKRSDEEEDDEGWIGTSKDRKLETGEGLDTRANDGRHSSSPLGIDMGTPEQSPKEERQAPETNAQPASPPGSPQDDLRQVVDQVRSQTLRMELSLHEQNLLYVSSAWEDLVGISLDDSLSSPIADFLYPDDAAVFAEATRQLEADDSHTVEVRFRLHVGVSSASSSQEHDTDDLYEVMEGKGMLMHDSLSGRPSHTMWVVRPCSDALPAADVDSTQVLTRPAADSLLLALEQRPSLASESILCRICERPSPAWFFEKHSETCNETHRLESDINDCNDRLSEFIKTINELLAHIDDTESDPLEYEGIPLLVSLGAVAPTYLEGIRSPLLPRSSSSQLRNAQKAVLEEARDIAEVALAISSPMLSEEQQEIPLQDQRLLSPNSEDKLMLVLQWSPPTVDEPAMSRIVADAHEQIRFKFNSVTRLRNTILYAEKIRLEWEAKATDLLNKAAARRGSSPFDSPQLQPMPNEASPLSRDQLQLPASAQPVPSTFLSPDSQRAPSLLTSPMSPSQALSPRLPSGALTKRSKESSIKDFKFIKAISKGAFGSVLLAKKIATGDYYAVKILKKSDMIAKNQVTNVKAERMILMNQTKSDFVVKLYYTFMNEDYLFLVMEYLNGGDCAALVKNLGGLPEDWAKRYIAEVTLGLQHLHASGIIHRDLKPDNLLIDAKGHLKLTDFGLSRIGVLGRQSRYTAVSSSRKGGVGAGRSSSRTSSPLSTPAFPIGPSQSSYFGSLQVSDSFHLDSPESSSASGSMAAQTARSKPQSHSPAVADKYRQFVGTPDYLAPESILGLGMDATVDWWALGVISYEFLYGFPPFSDSTPEKVFENILSRRFDWHEGEIEVSPEARDFIDRLMCSDPKRRLGVQGAEEVKAHPFLADIDWDNLLTGEVSFVPQTVDPEDTQYFDPRGASASLFDSALASKDDDANEGDRSIIEHREITADPLLRRRGTDEKAGRSRTDTDPSSASDDFGAFNFRNLHVLKQANDDVVRKLRNESLVPLQTDSSALDRIDTPQLSSKPSLASSPSSSTSESIQTRSSMPPTPLVSSSAGHSRNSSEQFGDRRPRMRQTSVMSPSDSMRRASISTRARAQSMSEAERPQFTDSFGRQRSRRTSGQPLSSSSVGIGQLADASQPPNLERSVRSPSLDRGLSPLAIPGPLDTASTLSTASFGSSQSASFVTRSAPSASVLSPASASGSAGATSTIRSNKKIDCLIAGRNPIANKVLDTLLTRLGCRCVVVQNGEDAIFAAAGVKFDIIWMDVQLPVVDGEQAARMIKSTKNPSCECPIVAVCSDQGGILDEVGTLFSAVLAKPVMKAQVLDIFAKLGYEQKTRTGTAAGGTQSRRGSADQLGRSASVTRKAQGSASGGQHQQTSATGSISSQGEAASPSNLSTTHSPPVTLSRSELGASLRRRSSLVPQDVPDSDTMYGGHESAVPLSTSLSPKSSSRYAYLPVIDSSNATTAGSNSPDGSDRATATATRPGSSAAQ